MKYKVEAEGKQFKVMFWNRVHELWLTYDTSRFWTKIEAEKYIKKLK